ncbi:hypothetical protein BDF20DRAFT_899198 [Mycotypha africana]|uniref:uncharacterized protein n=1 Tax=Mycotypha africana TaxID=64632 RepID=UPI0023019D21|nr:uncharacterized protein BDF20DRAFT_899198 [Mycotypha africana]KAI8967779.1 hypothetical protein BDF20DRAFT_899198 [Mycotypha africana]
MTHSPAHHSQSNFLQIFQDADHQIHDDSVEDPFPAYLDDIDTTLAPFCPTSAKRVLKALRMAHVGPHDWVIDLGSGDGRFVTAAVAEMNAAKAVGIESDTALVHTSKTLAKKVLPSLSSASLEDLETDRICFIEGDLLNLPSIVHPTPWTVIVLFLLPDHTDKFAHLLLHHYRRGARIVSLVFNLNEIPEMNLITSDEQDGIYVYGLANKL